MIGVVGVLLLVTASFPELTHRLAARELAGAVEMRTMLARDTLAMVARFPLFGVGLGNFEHTFPVYRSAGGVHVTHAHNDYLELAAEAGVPAVIMVAVLVVGLYRRARARIADDQPDRYLLWGIMVGLTALLLHSCVDFNFHVPANSLLWAALAGVAVRLMRRPALRVIAAPVSTGGRGVLPALVLGLTALAAVVASPAVRTELEFRRYYPDSSLSSPFALPLSSAGLTDAATAQLAARDAEHPFLLYAAGIERQRAVLSQLVRGEEARRLLAPAVSHHARAARALPQWAEPHLQLGILTLAGAATAAASDGEAALARAQRLDPHHAPLARTIAAVRSTGTRVP